MHSWSFETWLAIIGLCIGTALSVVGIAVNIWKPEIRGWIAATRRAPAVAAQTTHERPDGPTPHDAPDSGGLMIRCPDSEWLALNFAHDFSRFETSILTEDYKALLNLKRSVFAKLGGMLGGSLYILFLLLKLGTVVALCLWVLPLAEVSFLSVLALAVLTFGYWFSAYAFAATQAYRLEATGEALRFIPGGGRRGADNRRIGRDSVEGLGVDTAGEDPAAAAAQDDKKGERAVPYVVTAGRRLAFDTLLDSPVIMTPAEAGWLLAEIRKLWSKG